MPTEEQKQSLLEHLDKCEPEAWTGIMCYIVNDLAQDDQRLLAEILCREAERRAERASAGNAQHYASDHLWSVLDDIGVFLKAS